ncbi:MAG: hypothetical protein ABS910_02745 [Arthrobacter sp.]
MKSLRPLKAAGLVLAAVVLGLMSVQGSYALWNAVVPSNAGTVQSANFSILVNGEEMTGTQQTVNLPGLSAIKPGESTYATALVKNDANASSNMRVQPAVVIDEVPSELRGYMTVQAANLGAAQSCEKAVYEATPKFPEIAKGATATICFKVELRANTPGNLLGGLISVPVNLTVSQMKP